MGIDIHNLNFLAHAQDLGASFERTVSIGRQALFIAPPWLERHRKSRGHLPLHEPLHDRVSTPKPHFYEPMMRQWFAAKTVDSVDASAYEGARLIHDMNLPWPPGAAERGSYDAVLDFGCLEHIFNFPVAWRNCVDLCRVGGHLLHALPANNLSGHGFYQFSPELFYNLYRAENGFEIRAVFFALMAEPHHWWRVVSPLTVKRRVTLCNSHEVYMLVLARKQAEVGTLLAPQQSDYAQSEWLQPVSQGNGGAREATGRASRMSARKSVIDALTRLGWIDALRMQRERLRALQHSGLSLPPRDYRRVEVARLIAIPAAK